MRHKPTTTANRRAHPQDYDRYVNRDLVPPAKGWGILSGDWRYEATPQHTPRATARPSNSPSLVVEWQVVVI
jgi:hypothetical protein